MEAKRRGVRVVLFPCPYQGHINPMLQLASILYSNGFSITIIHTLFNSPNSSNYPHFTFIPISDGLSEAQVSSLDFVAVISHLTINCAVPLEDCLAGLLNHDTNGVAAEAEPILCLISDAVMPFTQGVADGLKLPRFALWVFSVEFFLAFTAFPVMRQKGYLPTSDWPIQPDPDLDRWTRVRLKRAESKQEYGIDLKFRQGNMGLAAPRPESDPDRTRWGPMLCRPSFTDQKVNARLESQVWRVGLQLENRFERGEIERIVRRLMVEKEGEEMRERVASLNEKAEVCLKKGGSSFESLEDLIVRILSF